MPKTKIVLPTVPAGLVSRPRLLAALDHAQDAVIILVCAPAGSGKTLLLAEWAAQPATGDIAWVSLDSDDNDDRRFWSTVLDALAGCATVPPDNPIRTLAVPPSPSANLGFLAEVVNALDDLPVPLRLILDDLQDITDPEPLRGLETLIRHRPSGLRLVLSSRHNPPLPLARLRLADQLAEIRADDLTFSLDEAAELLAAADVQVRPDQLRQLVEQTEGWAAGLRLAAVSLSDAEDADRFLADFAENDRAVADYLVDEVLSRLPDDMREFLSTITICDEVSAGLARAVSGRTDAGTMLDTLDEKTSLVVAVGGGWYRIHALIRSHLLADLTRLTPGRAAALHRKAADWFAEHDQPVRALAHAGRVPDTEQVATLLRRQGVSLTVSGKHEALRRALAVLGTQPIVEDSLLALVSALLHLEVGEPIVAEAHLAHAQAAWPADPTAELKTLRMLVQSRHAQVTGDIDDMLQATEHLGTPSSAKQALDALAMLHRGTALLAAGERGPARTELLAALAAGRDSDQPFVVTQCLTILGGLAGAVGDFPLMNVLVKEADRENVEHGWQHTIEGASAAMMLAYSALLRGELADCLRQSERAARVIDAGVPPVNQSLNLTVAALRGTARFELGDWVAGLREIRDARASTGDTRFSAEQVALCALLEHRAAVRLGWSDAARDVLAWAQTTIPGSGELLLMRARAQVALGRHGPAGKIIRRLLDPDTTTIVPWSVIEARLVEADIALRSGEGARARHALRAALSLGESLEVLYPLVCATPEIIELLSDHPGELGMSERFARRVLTLRRTLDAPLIPAPLTERERSVLRLLPTLRSLDEIAEDLTISPNTVKTHVRAIYTKLGVRKRRDAVVVALDRRLLETSAPPDADDIPTPRDSG